MITVATWNVLHRVHGENYAEQVLQCWPDEATRIAEATAQVAGCQAQAIALQEVSGDQLGSLRNALQDSTIHTLKYPRIPTLRTGTPQLQDPTEHLVLVTTAESHVVATKHFDNAPGKGALAVEIQGALVVALHLSPDRRLVGQLAQVAELVAEATGPTVLMGDFNADRETVAKILGDKYQLATITTPTRPGPPPDQIDQVAVKAAKVTNAAVKPGNQASDHNLVTAKIDY